jgi:colanic acid/amylovoran biosynthesis protein
MLKESRIKPEKKILISNLLLSNVGCEIILRGTISFLENSLSDYRLKFYIPSYQIDYDKSLVSDLENVQVIQMVSWKRYWRAILKNSGNFFKYWSPRFESKYFKQADMFVSVGGDIYTMFGNQLPEDWLGYENYATKHNIPSIMFGANMERFEILSGSDRKNLIDHLKRFKYIMARDNGTKEYLAKHSVETNTFLFPDPVFSLRTKTTFIRNKIQTIGINFTPIMLREYGVGIANSYAKLIVELLDKGYSIRLIPHVYSVDGNKGIDDALAMKMLLSKLPHEYRDKVSEFKGSCSFNSIQKEIHKIDLFIGARMHGCLNSLTLGKAVIFLAYSSKAYTMVETLKNETPFDEVKQSFIALSAEKLTISQIEELIYSHNHWAQSDKISTIIDTERYLDNLGVRQKVADIFKES